MNRQQQIEAPKEASVLGRGTRDLEDPGLGERVGFVCSANIGRGVGWVTKIRPEELVETKSRRVLGDMLNS